MTEGGELFRLLILDFIDMEKLFLLLLVVVNGLF